MSEQEYQTMELKFHEALDSGKMDPETALVALKLFAPDVAAKFEEAIRTKNVDPLLKKGKT